MSLQSKIKTLFRIAKSDGIAGVRQKLKVRNFEQRQSAAYRRWLARNETVSARKRAEMAGLIEAFDRRPLISIILPVYNVEEKWLRLCIESVLKQIYENWQLCIADDCSPSPHVRRTLDEYAGADSRISVIYRDKNGHISAASNSALELANGEFCILLDHDDELACDALFWVANEINDHPETAMIYSDEDMIDTLGRRFEPKFKPDFSRDLLYSLNLVTHLSAYKTGLMRELGGFRIGLEGSQDYDLALRAIEKIDAAAIRHIPRILYHWRAIPGSVALSANEKPYAHERARDAIREHFARTGVKARVSASHYNLHRVRYDVTPPVPRVSIIIDGSQDLAQLKTLADVTEYPDFEIIAVSAQDGAAVKDRVDLIRRLTCGSASRAERLNFAAERATGAIVVFLAGGVLPSGRGWLGELVGFAIQDGIGPVGGRVVSASHSVASGALVMDATVAAVTAHRGFPVGASGNMERNILVGNFSAVSADCFAIEREKFLAGGGFDDGQFPNALFAADLCLRLGKRGFRAVHLPFVEFAPNATPEATRQPSKSEKARFIARWQDICARDPFSNPNLINSDGSFLIDA